MCASVAVVCLSGFYLRGSRAVSGSETTAGGVLMDYSWCNNSHSFTETQELCPIFIAPNSSNWVYIQFL